MSLQMASVLAVPIRIWSTLAGSTVFDESESKSLIRASDVLAAGSL
jgi:hypothetical protein